ncbi:MAG: MmgE/PrpD family protein [bacterium]|nr:MmgE/PrpD family protein [bacterium]MDT8396162.1 MmgE/PrpD family protein [bacterium]
MANNTHITREIAEWSRDQTFDKIPREARRIAKRCVLDGLGLMVTGARQECTRIVRDYCLEAGGAAQATLFGENPVKVPAASAAMVNATSGHSMDWDDTQLSSYPDRVFGLLTHPGIRVNFGTMTKPLHVGRTAQSGVTAAELAVRGFEADPDGLDGKWGFFQVAGGGFDLDKIQGKLGSPFSIVDPGVSIKPYPCGSLTHPSMDAMLGLVTENDLKPEDVENVVLYAGKNILNPIRYETANNELEAKFCMPFLLSVILLERKAGAKEFTDEYVTSQKVMSMMSRVRTQVDPEIEAEGFDKMLSRVEIQLKDGSKLVRESDERYRGGPAFPLSDEELQAKFTDCTEHLLPADTRQEIFTTIAELEKPGNLDRTLGLIKGK